MKKIIIIAAFCLFGALAFVPFTLAGSSSHSGHSMDSVNAEMVKGKTMDAHAGHDMGKEKDVHAGHDMSSEAMENSHGGMMIHSSMVDGYHLSYELIDMMAKMKGMKNMPEMKATHHLMMFIKSHGGEEVKSGTVGFLIENPDGTKQKKMAMGMGAGYGADVELRQAGNYTITVKALASSDKIVDKFTYEIKGN